MRKWLIVLGITGIMLAACSEDRAPPAEKTGAAPATSAGQPAAMAKRPSGPGVIDHTQDEREFELRRSLAGTERMIQQYREDGHDTSELEARKAELEKKLQQLSG